MSCLPKEENIVPPSDSIAGWLNFDDGGVGAAAGSGGGGGCYCCAPGAGTGSAGCP